MHGGAVTIALLISFLWGLSPIIHKVVLFDVSHHTTMVISSMFYTLCTIGYATYYRKELLQDATKLNRKTIFLLAFTAVVCSFLTNVLYFRILKRYESHIVSALIYSCPVFTLIMAYYLLKERISFQGFLGVAFITIGVICLAYNKPGAEPFGIEH